MAKLKHDKDLDKLLMTWKSGRYSLKKLDDMTGRVIDNCSFFELDDLDDISEEALYENMLEEFPSWLKEAREIGLIAK